MIHLKEHETLNASSHFIFECNLVIILLDDSPFSVDNFTNLGYYDH